MTSVITNDAFLPHNLSVSQQTILINRIKDICETLLTQVDLTSKQKNDVYSVIRTLPALTIDVEDSGTTLKIPTTMEEAPVCHLICWNPKKNSKQASYLKAYVFLASVGWQQAQSLSGGETTIADACRAVRQGED